MGAHDHSRCQFPVRLSPVQMLVAAALAATASLTILPVRASAQEADQAAQTELARGRATWYGAKFNGRRTSSGERFDMNALTAAHESLPFGTRVLVRNISNGREVVVRINDRLPHPGKRVIDLSRAAAASLGILKAGQAAVVLFAEVTEPPNPQ